MPKYDLDNIKVTTSTPSTGTTNAALYVKLASETGKEELYYREPNNGTITRITANGHVHVTLTPDTTSDERLDYLETIATGNGQLLYFGTKVGYPINWHLLDDATSNDQLLMWKGGAPSWEDMLDENDMASNSTAYPTTQSAAKYYSEHSNIGSNLLPNSLLDDWSGGAAADPDYLYSWGDAGRTVARGAAETSSFGYKLTFNNGAGNSAIGYVLGQNGFDDGAVVDMTALKGKTVTFGVYAKTSDAGLWIAIDDDVNDAQSTQVTSDGSWHWTTITYSIASTATTIQFYLGGGAGDEIEVEQFCAVLGYACPHWIPYLGVGSTNVDGPLKVLNLGEYVQMEYDGTDFSITTSTGTGEILFNGTAVNIDATSASTFVELTDTPDGYTTAGALIKVNDTTDGLVETTLIEDINLKFPVINVVDSTSSVDLTDTGALVIVDSTDAFHIDVPALSASTDGTHYRFVKLNSGNLVIHAAPGNYFIDEPAGVGTLSNTVAAEDYAMIHIVAVSPTLWTTFVGTFTAA